ncbi:MAG: hypothetical protein FWF12_04460 [Betaproteobacteria bacterium]|nr:hypothetical protein [Betaproteobacteria bacterium]
MANIETAVNWAVNIAKDSSHGYTQNTNSKVGETRDGGTDYDCSSLVCHALRQGGFSLGAYQSGGSFSTHYMKDALTSANGWTCYDNINTNTMAVKRGDVLWRSEHTAIAISSTELVEARINEKGGILGGAPGDQLQRQGKSLEEIGIRKINASGFKAFTRIWRYTGGGSTVPAPVPTPPPSPGKLTEDGLFGTTTVKRWQQVMGTPADGIISGQFTGNKQYHQASAAIQYGSGGSSLVRAVQQKLGIAADGHLGPNTIKAIQKRLGVTADGYFAAKPSETVKALQRKLNTGTF